MIGHRRVVAVVVRWNREKLLTEYLTLLDAQPRWPDVGAVDNPSTGGSQEIFGTRFPEVHLGTLTCNTERAGGFSPDPLHHGVHDKMRILGAGDAVAPGEADVRVGSAQRNSALSYRHCHHKAAMRGELKKGLCGELRTRPRPTHEVLGEAGCELAPHW
jgi:hypothetical protein